MLYVVGFIVVVIIFSLISGQRSSQQAKFRKTKSGAASDSSFNYYGANDDKHDNWDGGDSGYDGGGSDGGSDGGGGGGSD
ncbi:hypothetical protein [Planococcus sp. YIM B11945]|uniref:hypothetical protein n=1 Tax=Planococcus sp. YIM B11945 TaxID=3435410 RepID=UPI003D7D8BCD